ncbi:chaplin [Streptacidiphilus jiangxiensis]|uniref:Small secreted domain n=1 Tax=Streptacidiphilus jiangxiensis TaxID=235985 RepID=A0A1H7HC59_STRJI|nr:chaplin [Streptacidiphilus jiangxiensis]SEK47849.1 Small secreted domain [Streptacidiphilus jiangxiensis]
MHSIRRTLALLVITGASVLGAAGAASADGATANGVAYGSPGFLSGNLIQVPIDVDVNACGNSVNVVGALDPAFGNRCSNGEGGSEHGWEAHNWGWNHGYDDDHAWSWNHDEDHADDCG